MASIYVICAILGNMWRESHVNPNCGELGGGSGWGLGQWSGNRRTALLNYLVENGYDKSSGRGQLEFLIYENDWINNYGGYPNLQSFLNSESTDINELTKIYMKCWERPGVEALADRQSFAQSMYEWLLEGNTYDGEWILTPVYYLSYNQAKKNGYLVYQFFMGVLPDDPVPPDPVDPDDPVYPDNPDWQGEHSLILYSGAKKRRNKLNANTIIRKFQ